MEASPRRQRGSAHTAHTAHACVVATIILAALHAPTTTAFRLDCTYTAPDCPAVRYDLTPLMNSPDLQAPVAQAGNEVEWLRVCQPANEPCDQSTVPQQSRAGVQTWSSGSGPTCAVTGDLSTARWGLVREGDAKGGVKMAFTGGDGGRTMQVLFLCDPTLAGSTQVSAKEQPQGSDNYVITVRAAAACPTGDCPAVPWSTGWLVFTLTCVFICVYFVCGSYYNYRFQDAEGLDVIPQWRYWQQLPGLVKDGCIFSRAKAAIFYRLALNAIRQCSDSSKEMRDGGATSGLVPAASDG